MLAYPKTKEKQKLPEIKNLNFLQCINDVYSVSDTGNCLVALAPFSLL